MKGAFALLILSAPFAAAAADVDGGVQGSADGGSPDAGLAYNLAEPVETPLPQLEGGSELAAGVDPASVDELVHPASLTDLKAAVRRLGGPFEGGKTSVALQLNPYLVTTGSGKAYELAVGDRDHLYWRILQDSALSASVTPGSPFKGSVDDQAHFTTVGLGASVELLGQRSPFTQDYQSCIDGKVSSEILLKTRPQPVPTASEVAPKPEGDKPADADRAKDGKEAGDLLLHVRPQPAADARKEARDRFEASVKSLLATTVHDALKTCNAKLSQSNGAFVSVGGRWILPGTSASDVDRVRVQREFVALFRPDLRERIRGGGPGTRVG